MEKLGEIKYIIKIIFTCWILPFEKVATRKSPSTGITHMILSVSIFLEQVVRNADASPSPGTSDLKPGGRPSNLCFNKTAGDSGAC